MLGVSAAIPETLCVGSRCGICAYLAVIVLVSGQSADLRPALAEQPPWSLESHSEAPNLQSEIRAVWKSKKLKERLWPRRPPNSPKRLPGPMLHG